MRLKLNILLITLLALFSCAKESGERGSDDQGTGTLYVRFDIPANAGVTKVDGGSGGGIMGLIMFWRKIILFGTGDCFWWIRLVMSWLIARLRIIKMVS